MFNKINNLFAFFITLYLKLEKNKKVLENCFNDLLICGTTCINTLCNSNNETKIFNNNVKACMYLCQRCQYVPRAACPVKQEQ